MADDFISLSNRLLSRAPSVGILLAQQLVQDSWHQLQARREWSWRRKSSIFQPPALYSTGTVSTNVGAGQPTLITGSGTVFTPSMIGRQIRLNGLLNPYYTIIGWLSATQILIDTPWAGVDLTGVGYQIIQIYYPVPSDFGWFYTVTSPKDGFRLWTNLTQSDLSAFDPQRAQTGQTYAVVYRDSTPIYTGTVGAVIPVGATGASPISTTTLGFSYPAPASYIIQIVTPGSVGTATFKWMRVGQGSFSLPVLTDSVPIDLMDGVQVYFPTGLYLASDLFIVNCLSSVSNGVPRYELWPGPTAQNYLYPYTYIAKESDLSVASPALPPEMSGRGEVILEMALAKCATFPGPDSDHPNPYFNLTLARFHEAKVSDMLVDLERNDEEVGVTNVTYQQWPAAPMPFFDGAYQQRHAPFG